MMNCKHLLAATAALVLCVAQADAQGTVGKDARVNLRVEGRALSEIAQYLRDQSGANIVVLDGGDSNVSLELTDVPWREALEIAAEAAKCVVEERTGGILAILKPKRVTYETKGTDITEVIELIAKLGGANIVVAPEVKGTLSLRLNDVPWRDALDVAVKTLGYVVVEENRGILRVVDPASLQSQMVTKSYQFRYLRPKSVYKPQIKSEFLQPVTAQAQKTGPGVDPALTFTVLKALQKALSAGGGMDYIETQNVIIVRDTAQVQDSIREMIARLDIEPSQVFVDVKFVSTLNTELLDLGVDYGDGGPQIGISGGQIPITLPFGLGNKGWEDGIIASPSGSGPFADPLLNGGNTIIPDTVFGKLSFTGVAATLKMLQRDTKSEVVQAPKLIAIDGNESTIFVGETIRYAEAKSEQGQAGGLQLSLSEASGSPVDIGFQLLIVPHVIPGTNNLTLEVIPKETSLSGTGSSALAPTGFDVFTVGASGLEGSIALPRTRSSTIVTTMLLESGQTAVIGGLTTETDQKSVSRVPYLSRIPLLGEFFKYKKTDRQRRSLVVFLTPTIVHSSSEQELILQRELKRRSTRLKDEIEALVRPMGTDTAAPAGQ
jgi:type IV pilus assembly protein PilQ